MRNIVLACALLAAAGCGSSTTAPASTTTAPTTQYFSGILAVRGTSFAPVTITQDGALTVTLTSVAAGAAVTNPALSTVLALSVGVASTDGLSCTVSATVNTAPGLVAQLTTQAVAGTSCVQITDFGNLAAPANFVVRIVHT